jgi:hypothetical protein
MYVSVHRETTSSRTKLQTEMKGPDLVVYTCNPSYMGGIGRFMSEAGPGQKAQRSYFKNN